MVAICTNIPVVPVFRSILKPVSLSALSCQTRATLFCDKVVAESLLGATGLVISKSMIIL